MFPIYFFTISFLITSHVRGTEITSRFGGFTYRIMGEGMTRPPETVLFPPACQQAAVWTGAPLREPFWGPCTVLPLEWFSLQSLCSKLTLTPGEAVHVLPHPWTHGYPNTCVDKANVPTPASAPNLERLKYLLNYCDSFLLSLLLWVFIGHILPCQY